LKKIEGERNFRRLKLVIGIQNPQQKKEENTKLWGLQANLIQIDRNMEAVDCWDG